MTAAVDAQFHGQLAERRARLVAALPVAPDRDLLEGLLAEVDAALARLGDGSFGLCEVCHDPIEVDRLAADPLIRYCLDHLTRHERAALERDLATAARIQAALLPPPDVAAAGWESHYRYLPAGPVSGDFCDLIAPAAGGLHVVVGDVSGKGVSASIVMSHLQAIFRSLIAGGGPVAQVLAEANRMLCEATPAAHYATVVYAALDARGGVELASAGHPPPLVVRRGGVEPVAAQTLPVGLFCAGRFAATRLDLAPGDALVLYTDGLTEAADRHGEEYGPARLAAALAPLHGASPATLAAAALDDLRRFLGGTSPADDLTVLALRRAVPS